MKSFKVIAVSILALSFAGIASAQDHDHQGRNFKSGKDQPTHQRNLQKRSPAHHRNDKRSHHRGHRKAPICHVGKLSADQRTQLKSVRQDQMKTMKTLMTELKAARIEFRKVVSNADSTIEEAQTANLAVQAKMNSIASARQAAKLKLMYEVLDADQRVKLAKCFEKSARKRQAHKAPAKKPAHRSPVHRG